jgi:hypothetical protein
MGRGRRRKLLPRTDQEGVVRRLELVADEIADIGDLIGSAYGAAWCNKALKLHRSVHLLRQQVIDHYDDLIVEARTGELVSDLERRYVPLSTREV